MRLGSATVLFVGSCGFRGQTQILSTIVLRELLCRYKLSSQQKQGAQCIERQGGSGEDGLHGGWVRVRTPALIPDHTSCGITRPAAAPHTERYTLSFYSCVQSHDLLWSCHNELREFSDKALLSHSPSWAGVLPGTTRTSLFRSWRSWLFRGELWPTVWLVIVIQPKNRVPVEGNRWRIMQWKHRFLYRNRHLQRGPTLNGPPFPSSSSRMYPSTPMVERGGCFHDNVALLFWVQHSSSWSIGAAGTAGGEGGGSGGNQARLHTYTHTRTWTHTSLCLHSYFYSGTAVASLHSPSNHMFTSQRQRESNRTETNNNQLTLELSHRDKGSWGSRSPKYS